MSEKFDLARALRVASPVAVKFAAADKGTFEGYASVFGNTDAYGEVTQPGAFAATLAAWRAEGALPPLLWSHQPDEPVGRIVELREDDKGLFVSGQFNLATAAGREAFEHVKAGDINGLSFGFRLMDGGAQRNADGTISLTAIDLLEISVVALPANRRARISEVKMLASQAELERALRELNLPHRAVAKMAPAAWAALHRKPMPLDALGARIDATIKAVTSFNER